MDLDVGLVEEAPAADVAVVHHLLPLVPAAAGARPGTTQQRSLSYLRSLWFGSDDAVWPDPAVVWEGGDRGVRELLLVVLGLHHLHVLELDLRVADRVGAGDGAPQNGG